MVGRGSKGMAFHVGIDCQRERKIRMGSRTPHVHVEVLLAASTLSCTACLTAAAERFFPTCTQQSAAALSPNVAVETRS